MARRRPTTRGGSLTGISIVRFVLAFGLLLIPTAFMGATLPVISKFAVRQFVRLGSSVGLLYAANTLGAVAGIAVVTFVLMEALGLRASSYVVDASICA